MCNTENTSEHLWNLVNQIIEENIDALRALATEYTSQAMASPNTETLAAIETANRGEIVGPFESVEDLMAALNDGFDDKIHTEGLVFGG